MERKIRMVLLDYLTPEDLLKLKHGGFFEGAHMAMPGDARGQEATFKVPTSPVVFPPVAAATPGVERVREVPVVLGDKLDPGELANTSETMKPVKTKKPKASPPLEEQLAGNPTAEGNAKSWNTLDATNPLVKERESKVPTSSEVIQQTKDVEQAEKVLDEARSVERAANAAAESDTGDIDPDKLTGFTKLRDLIQYLIESGIQPDGIAVFCESVKDTVPLLSRISNITERVARTLEVMGV